MRILGLLSLALLCLAGFVFAPRLLPPVQQPAGNTPSRPIPTADWVATDALGRTLPSPASTGPPKAGKYVGMFYFLWHGSYDPKGIYDISKSLRASPGNPAFGPEQAFHWWGEPEAGYFRADDPWVLRRNLQLLTNAGVDVLFMDVTNGDTYLPTVRKLCETATQMRQQGIQTPAICFITYAKTAETVNDLYTNFYARNQYADLWFRWRGKPLLLGKAEEVSDAGQRDYFTWRYSWAWTNARNEPRHWQWIDDTPQDYGWETDPAIPEEIPVAVAGHPIRNIGKSYRAGKQVPLTAGRIAATSSAQGLYFGEQWQRALAVNPELVLVSSWNEWIAQRYTNQETDPTKTNLYLGEQMKPKQSYFVDLYNEEFNRDIEPMKGGYTDSYYYQLVANIRKFKGLTAPRKPSAPRTITLDGRFTDWASVQPVFTDPAGDIAPRNWPRFDNQARNTNTTGRNDIVESRATYDGSSVYFFARTARSLSPVTGKRWMLLFIDTDQSARTGWQGYDLVVNRQVGRVHRWQRGAWQPVASPAPYRVGNNQLELQLPRSLFGRGQPRFDFHWADNIQKENDIAEFFINGDSAPDRRFNFRYE